MNKYISANVLPQIVGFDKNIFVVHGKNSYHLSGASGYIDRIVCERFGSYSDISPNPKKEEYDKLAEEFSSRGPMDYIIAVGGGTIIDMGKLLSADFNVPLVVVPTTAGTGSEVTPFAVLYVDGEKTSVSVPPPDYVVVDYRLTRSMPEYLTACCGMDVLAQGIESFWSKLSTEQSRGFSEKAIRYVMDYLTLAMGDDDVGRFAMSTAAHYSGMAIAIGKTTACHALSYEIGKKYDLPHGHAVALTLPEVFWFNMGGNSPREQALLEIMGYSEAGMAYKHLKEFNDKLGLWVPEKVDKEDLRFIASKVNHERLANNPVKPNFNDLMIILERSFGL